ncbi:MULTISPECIES: hypothetical protein [Halomonas]|uniref:hypothetical protein n=1 Tax=Halomonas TaxID=2745 RepID=UPI000EBC8478|nr:MULTISPECIES: hypothetical protein [Halomonas]HCR98129.1 hypothetical protein [Halomonas sp.]
MKPFSILLIRLLAIYLAITPLLSVSPLLFSPGYDAELAQWLPWLAATAVIPIIAGIVLWFSAVTLANKFFGEERAEPALTIAEEGLVRAGSFLIGVYLFVQHLSTAIGQWAWGGIVAYGSLAAVVLSIGLIVGARFLAKLYRRLKYFE